MSGVQGVQAQPFNLPSPFLQAPANPTIQVPNPQGTFNPLQAQGQALQNQGQANANQTSQLDVQKAVAARAIGQHIQANTQNGQVNWAGALQDSAADAHAAYGMPALVDQAINVGNVQASTARTILANQTEKYQNLQNITLPLLNKGANVNIGDVANSFAQGAAAGLFDTDTALANLNSLRQAAPDNMGPNGQYLPNPVLAKMIQGHANMAAGAQAALQATLGSPFLANVGGQQVPVALPQQGPARVTGQSLVNTPTPSELNAPTPGVTPQGTPTVQGAGTARVFVDGNGQPVNPQAPAAHALTLDPQSQDVVTRLAPQYQQEADAATPALTTINNLQKVLATSPQQFGSSATAREGLAKVFQSVPGMPQSVVDGVSGGNLASLQEAQKLMFAANANLLLQLSGHAGQTDQESAAARAALLNPNTDPRATAAILGQVKSQAELPVLRAQAYQQFYQKQASDSPYIDKATGKPATIGEFPSIYQKALARSGRTGMATIPLATGGGGPEGAPTGVTP